ncbi:hypothetical protein [Streptomyces sp. NRRL S-15]|uniref:hypothetical protein n=1 Tax=Streptomyces sp. NRRL S-15 TaxID=1463886 RepID=UPI00131E12F5|nr:hypothetical protein [Streptomyces sp. NRRL S-15]
MISRKHDSAHRLGAGSPLLARAEVQLRTDPGRFPAPILLNQQVLTTAPGTHARPPHGDGFGRPPDVARMLDAHVLKAGTQIVPPTGPSITGRPSTKRAASPLPRPEALPTGCLLYTSPRPAKV